MKVPEREGEPVVVWQAPYPSKIVVRQDFRMPSGKLEDFYFWGRGGRPVIVLPFTEEGEIILTHQWRPAIDSVVIEAPGGHPRRGNEAQSVEDLLREELLSETGYEPQRIAKIPEFNLDPPSNATVVVAYIAYDCRRVGEPKPESGEVLERRVMGFSYWLRSLWKEGPDKDSKTVTALFLALPYLPVKVQQEFLRILADVTSTIAR